MKAIPVLSTLSTIAAFLIVNFASAGTPVVGKWKTIDDETNEAKSIVQIFERDGKYYGKIIKLFLQKDEDQNPICDKCNDKDDRKDQLTLGMEIIRDLEEKKGEYSSGTILDPENGKVYDCKLWIEEGNLKLRGYIAFFFRTQTWHRVE